MFRVDDVSGYILYSVYLSYRLSKSTNKWKTLTRFLTVDITVDIYNYLT